MQVNRARHSLEAGETLTIGPVLDDFAACIDVDFVFAHGAHCLSSWQQATKGQLGDGNEQKNDKQHIEDR